MEEAFPVLKIPELVATSQETYYLSTSYRIFGEAEAVGVKSLLNPQFLKHSS
jgi:hypothetical protein